MLTLCAVLLLCSVHEVYIDDAQFQWFEAVLQQNRDKPIIVFTHAPPMGCGLKVVEDVHVKNRCAFLNHSDRPQRFIKLVEQHPNIKLWFSGHFHLSQVSGSGVGCGYKGASMCLVLVRIAGPTGHKQLAACQK